MLLNFASLLWAQPPRIITPDEFRAGAIVQPEPWIIQHLVDHPEAMQDLNPWQFQVAMAGLLERRGLKVTLGPRGADQGVDIRAERDSDYGQELILVQTKHPKPGNKVDVETVRLLHYEVRERHATRGLVMTDSSFTRCALDKIEEYRVQMAGADGERIRQWLEALRTGAPGAGPWPQRVCGTGDEIVVRGEVIDQCTCQSLQRPR